MDKYKKNTIKAIRTIWSSLDSHLENCVENDKLPKKCLKVIGKKSFHLKTVKEYLFVIKTLIDQF